jgi:hypothetical protein
MHGDTSSFPSRPLKNCFRPRYFTPAAKAAIENTAGYRSAESAAPPKIRYDGEFFSGLLGHDMPV